MVDNPTKIYNDYIRANLPNSMSYDTGTDRYDINSHSFFKFKNSNWYFNYISKYGYSALSAYAVNNFEPALVFDFKGNYFRKSATASTFGASITHAATTNATMVDSDGLLKWRPHNNLTKSNTFSTWLKNSIVVDNAAVGPNGIANTASTVNFPNTTSYLYNLSTFAVGVGDKVTLAAWVRSDTITSITFSTNGRTNPANNTSEVNLAVTSTWTLVSFESTVAGNDTGLFFIIGKINPASPASQIGDLELYGAHMFRSDLGGMVNDPDRGDSYVPTTTTPVYLSRRGHHIYNGSAWVNEGILHESEARTNLLTSSGDVTGTGWVQQIGVTSTATGSPFGSYQSASPTSTSSSEGQSYQIGKPLTLGGTTYVGWSLAKYSAGNGWFSVSLYDTGSGNNRGWFDLQNGVVGSKDTNIIDHGMIDYGDGWWLCWVSKAAASTSGGISLGVPTGDGATGRNSADVILIAGSQLEAGATPSSYIPTTTASVTRAAETLTVPAANLPYNSTNMSIQMDGKMTYADTGVGATTSNNVGEVTFVKWQEASTQFIGSVLNTNTSRVGQVSVRQRHPTGGFDEVTSTVDAYTPDTNVPFNLAGRHGSTFINGAHNGTLLTANTTPTALPALSSTDLELVSTFMGTIGEFRMWSDDITDTGITEATLPSTEPSLSLTFDGSETSFIVLDWSE
jgi:hypothetical protein